MCGEGLRCATQSRLCRLGRALAKPNKSNLPANAFIRLRMLGIYAQPTILDNR